ncbi:hypothetical protein FZEAL_1680 [Fusarium zealandicum]|uniref:Zn(2)-C6 fungal-type domain-containing protein n=1 Tax=Fusarium zealandicum TaxID=1053134 RepID=A0A8H4USB1_9HYPO|nr:hypothetical protein FZEAL_1680 [Fusarium zealandicum]
MEEISPSSHVYPLADSAPDNKRKRLRKGTQSCWECKRRKARCTFSADTQDVCEGYITPVVSRRLRGLYHEDGTIEEERLGLGHRLCAPAARFTPQSLLMLSARYTTDDQVVPTQGVFDYPRSNMYTPNQPPQPTIANSQSLVGVTASRVAPGIPQSSARHLGGLSTSPEELMARLVKTAHNLVTCNDELVASIEGIESIMLEGLYENYMGNLRCSWLAARRAVMIAQMLGLNRGVKPFSLTGATVEADQRWFRLIQLDRYLSLMLVLPQSSLEDDYATPEALESCLALERMQRLICVAAGRLLRRGSSDMYDPTTTKEIDKLLRAASVAMPAQWWVSPSLPSCSTYIETIQETLRFNDHFMHYHSLLLLHMPYLVPTGPGFDYEYNRMTAVTAGREIISRFLSFRASHSADYYCRGVDFLASISSTALCLAHITGQGRCGTDEAGYHFLAHQQLSDRGMLEQTLEKMQDMATRKDDPIATQVATLLRHLLAIEEDVASGGRYSVNFDPKPKEEGDLGSSVKLSDDDTVLNIYIPHLWVIKIKWDGVGQKTLLLSEDNEARSEQGEYESVVAAARNEAGALSPGRVWQNQPTTQLTPLAANSSYIDPQGLINSDEGLNGLGQDAIIGDWALQDMDMPFLDSFIEGSAGLEILDVQ